MATLLFPEMAEPQYGFGFPVPLSEKYRPRLIADFAGLSETKKVLTGFVRNPSNCGFLFVGPAGTGKTSMGLALAGELRAFVHHVPAQECTVETVRKLAFDCNYYPPMGYKRHLILIDEADLMSAAAQNAILSKLDGTEPVPDTVWVFTCNAVWDREAPQAEKPNFARIIKDATGNVRAALMSLEMKMLAA